MNSHASNPLVIEVDPDATLEKLMKRACEKFEACQSVDLRDIFVDEGGFQVEPASSSKVQMSELGESMQRVERQGGCEVFPALFPLLR
jgi:hypothetical protein